MHSNFLQTGNGEENLSLVSYLFQRPMTLATKEWRNMICKVTWWKVLDEEDHTNYGCLFLGLRHLQGNTDDKFLCMLELQQHHIPLQHAVLSLPGSSYHIQWHTCTRFPLQVSLLSIMNFWSKWISLGVLVTSTFTCTWTNNHMHLYKSLESHWNTRKSVRLTDTNITSHLSHLCVQLHLRVSLQFLHNCW